VRSAIRVSFVACLIGVASGCISVVEPAVEEALGATPDWEALPSETSDSGAAVPFIGLELEEELVGSLESPEFLPGLRVKAVVAGSPAEGAGIAPGDRVLRVGEAELRSIEQWQVLLSAMDPGERVTLEIERAGALATAQLAVLRRGGATLLPGYRFIERRRLNCAASTVSADSVAGRVGGRHEIGVRLDEIGPRSVLRGSGLREGDVLVELDSTPLAGTEDLFRRVAAAPDGATLRLTVLASDGVRLPVDVALETPPRHLTEISLWPLFSWSETPDERHGKLVIGDLWLIWLFRREHDGDASRTSILRLLSWESGLGVLDEESGGDEGGR
jgi:membrane-associated protease RseP (regulator of RpoE activity)